MDTAANASACADPSSSAHTGACADSAAHAGACAHTGCVLLYSWLHRQLCRRRVVRHERVELQWVQWGLVRWLSPGSYTAYTASSNTAYTASSNTGRQPNSRSWPSAWPQSLLL